MQAKIKVQMENSAFQPKYGPELARILRELADKIEDYRSPEAFNVYDANGNKVGEVVIKTTSVIV